MCCQEAEYIRMYLPVVTTIAHVNVLYAKSRPDTLTVTDPGDGGASPPGSDPGFDVVRCTVRY